MQCLVQRKPKRNIQKEKIETDKRRKHFFHTFLYLLGEWTNQRYVPRRSVVPKTSDSKMMLLVRRTLPHKTQFTENLSIYLFPPAPNSPLQNPSNFGATASQWLLYFLLFFLFFWFLTGWMRGALYMATRLYILYVAADESTSGWEFYCKFLNPHISMLLRHDTVTHQLIPILHQTHIKDWTLKPIRHVTFMLTRKVTFDYKFC